MSDSSREGFPAPDGDLSDLASPVHLTGQRVCLRPVQITDLDRSLPWRNDPEIRDNVLGYPGAVSREQEERWYQRILEERESNRLVLGVEDLSDGVLVGFIQLSDIDRHDRTAQLGLTIGEKSRQGRGLGREALGLMVDYAFDLLELNRIWIRVVAYNERALTLYRKMGFQDEGILRQHAFRWGSHHNVHLLGLMAAEWREGGLS
ncbi:MAG: GNAT family N-acetyltransferase [Magnetococcales bacterium]|nr:GNAT family N-acetyltransferase [Magnetococcales bacterium]